MIERFPLIVAPTPMHRLDRLSNELGIDLWIKRDDLTGFALGGNKGRKLEYLIAEALAQKADVVVTCGSAQSNFIRQMGAACAVAGLRCAAAAMALPFDAAAGKPKSRGIGDSGGNVWLDELFGVDLRVFPDDDWETLFAHAEDVARVYESRGKKVFFVPIGGSTPQGAYAFYEAAKEVGEGFDWVVTATSSGSTQTGLAYGFDGTATKVLGIACDPEPGIARDFAAIGAGLAKMIGHPRVLGADDFRIDFDSVGEGYGVPSAEGDAAIRAMALREGILLDPVYTGKAFAGLMRLAASGSISGRVLFWHTGGTPALFAHGSD